MTSKVLSRPIQDLDKESVIEQIIKVSALSYDRLPVMEVIFERYALILAPALKIYTAATADVMLDSLEYLSCGEALEGLDSLSFVAVANASTNGEQIGLVLNTELLFNNLEIMLGGSKVASSRPEKRSFTMIEKRLGTRFCEIALTGLSEALSQFSDIQFQIDAVESNPRNAMLAPLGTASLKVSYRVKLNGREGMMTFIVPNPVIEDSPVLMSQSFLVNKSSADQSATSTMATALQDAEVSMMAVLRSMEIPLSTLLGLRPGSVIALDIDASEEAVVYCSNKSMFNAAIGRKKNDFLAARVTSGITPTPDDLMSRINNG